MKTDFNKNWRDYVLLEGRGPDVGVWIQSLKENLGLFRPRTVKEGKRIILMQHQLNEVKKSTNRLLNEIKELQEENKLLQERKEDEREK
tara:strand:+ start:186 stop:452 length:267 start_codon:yes stop_codon:yes gene_type:complete